MTRVGALAIWVAFTAAAAPVSAQLVDPLPADRLSALVKPALEEPLPDNGGLSFRLGEQIDPDGTRHERRGIIAGFDVAPDTVVGLGLFETLPKRVVRSEESALDKPKRSRKAAVGLTLKF